MDSTFSARIRAYYNSFSASEKKIADYLMENADTACLLSIQELAQTCETSSATLSRFAKRMGCQNYQELRMLLNAAKSVDAKTFFKTMSQEDSLLSIATSHFLSSEHALSETRKVMHEEQLHVALALLKSADHLGFFGLGGSSVVSFSGYHRFLRTSLQCVFNLDYHIQLMNAAKLTQKDCAIVVSHTGRNKDILRVTEILRRNRVPIIAISSSAASPLAKQSTVALISVSDETEYRPEAVTSLVSHLAIMDILFSLYSIKTEHDNVYFAKLRDVINQTREPYQPS